MQPATIDMVFTSPSPFGYGGEGIGSEKHATLYLMNLFKLFHQVSRVLKPQGCCFVQMPDYHDPETGSMRCIPEAFLSDMLQEGWLLRSKCIWVRTEKFDYQEDYTRFARDWEYLYFFTKSKDHYFNNPHKKIQSSVFSYPYKAPRKQEFESGFPEKIIERCINLSCPPKDGVILDPLSGSGTTGLVAKRMGRQFIMIEKDFDKVLAMRARLGGGIK